jgi:hypothetical protein
MTPSASGDFLVPFKGRNYSGYFEQNFLWRHDNVYVMDNHRAALWCWLQHINPRRPHAIFHVDRHYDTLNGGMEDWLENLPANWSLSIDEYLSHSYEASPGEIQLFRFDNYLSIYLQLFGQFLTSCHFATHNDGEKPNLEGIWEHYLWQVPENLDFWIEPKQAPWIANIDLDYFFCDAKDADKRQLMVSHEYIEAVFDTVRERMDDGSIAVTTIALSPEYCGGWEPSEQVMEIALARLGIDFRLPIA